MTRRKSELPRAVLLCAGLLLGAALLGMGQSRAGETPYCRMELPPGYALVQPEDGGPVSLTKDGAVTGGLRLLGGGGDRALEHDILWSSYLLRDRSIQPLRSGVSGRGAAGPLLCGLRRLWDL